MPVSSAIDPSRYSSLALTHVQYDRSDPLAKLLALITLSPIFLLCAYVTIILYRRELTFINAFVGQLGCEGVNWALKRIVKQPRPTDKLGSGYGMPSSHSQFIGFFAAFFLAHFALHHPPPAKPRTLINTMRRLEHAAAMLLIVLLTAAVCYSRYHLSYHSPAQIIVGLTTGFTIGSIYYYLTEHIPRKPLRLPAPLGSPAPSPAPSPVLSKDKARLSFSSSSAPPSLRQRGQTGAGPTSPNASEGSGPKTRPRRGSGLIPELHPAPPLRQLLLDHPIAVALRVRDSWTVWTDGGIEGEYGAWRREWERRRKPWYGVPEVAPPPAQGSSRRRQESAPQSLPEGPSSPIHFEHMAHALRLADLCEPLVTAFCVGCVITTQEPRRQVIATGFSRELPGNTHAEQCALDKLLQNAPSSSSASTQAEQIDRSEKTYDLDLYTTMEPCSERLSGNAPCVSRILSFNRANHLLYLPDLNLDPRPVRVRIGRVFQGVSEPPDFVLCEGQRTLRETGVEVHTVRSPAQSGNGSGNGTERGHGNGKENQLEEDWLEKECLRIAKKGHNDEPACVAEAWKAWGGSRPASRSLS